MTGDTEHHPQLGRDAHLVWPALDMHRKEAECQNDGDAQLSHRATTNDQHEAQTLYYLPIDFFEKKQF